MSSDESKRNSGNQAKYSSELDYDIPPASAGERNLDSDIKPTEQQPSSIGDSTECQYEPTTGMDISVSTSKPLPSTMEEVQETAEFLSSTIASSSHSSEKQHDKNISTAETKKDAFLNPASESKEKTDKGSSFAKPAPFKEFPPSLLDLPFTKEKLAESLSLEEACGFLPYLMKTKRVDLRGKEGQVDQISIDLQIALRDAKNICIILEKALKDVPKDVNAARTQAQRLKYLLSSSFSVFQKLDRLGKALKENIQVYSKQTGDYHSSVDVLLDYIVENILKKCSEIKRTL